MRPGDPDRLQVAGEGPDRVGGERGRRQVVGLLDGDQDGRRGTHGGFRCTHFPPVSYEIGRSTMSVISVAISG
jgi:hypothetical protein